MGPWTNDNYMNTANMHVGPVGANNDANAGNGSFLETGPEFKPKEMEDTLIGDVLVGAGNSAAGAGNLNQNQYPVGVHNIPPRQ